MVTVHRAFTKEKRAKNGRGCTKSIEEVKPLRVSLYLRVSTDDQTIDMQRDYLIKYAKEKGYRIFTEYVDEDRTGRTMDRSGFQNLLKALKYKGFDAVLVYKSDRLFRNLKDALNMMEVFEKEGTKLLSATDPQTFDRITADGKLSSSVMLAVAEYWSDSTTQKIMDGRNYAIKKGHFCARPPFGYKVVDHKLVVDEDKREIVQEVFRDKANGFSWGDLSKKYNIRKSTLQGIIANPIYKTGTIKIKIEGKEREIGKVDPILTMQGGKTDGRSKR